MGRPVKGAPHSSPPPIFSALSFPTLTTLLTLFLLYPVSSAQLMNPLEDYMPQGVEVRKSDLPYIQCGVCKKLSEKLVSILAEKKKKSTPSKPVDELQIIELTEKICDRKTIDGGWILRMDMEEDGDKIKLVEYDYDGNCRSECRTIQKACENIMGYHDTDVAELLEKPGMTHQELEKKLCYELSDACVKPIPPLPKDRKPGEKFERERPKDYAKMAEEMGIKSSVMHDMEGFQMPEGVPQMEAPKTPKKSKRKKAKKGDVEGSGFESMSEL